MRGLLARWRDAPRDETFGWTCLVANLVGVPGMGTLLAGRRSGILQLVLAGIGGVLITAWLLSFLATVLATKTIPEGGGPYVRPALVGLATFAVAWLWSLASSVSILREMGGRAPSTSRKRASGTPASAR